MVSLFCLRGLWVFLSVGGCFGCCYFRCFALGWVWVCGLGCAVLAELVGYFGIFGICGFSLVGWVV